MPSVVDVLVLLLLLLLLRRVRYCVGGAHFRASHKQSSSTANDVSVFHLMLSALCACDLFFFYFSFVCLLRCLRAADNPKPFSLVAAPAPTQSTESFKICTLLFAYEINSP